MAPEPAAPTPRGQARPWYVNGVLITSWGLIALLCTIAIVSLITESDADLTLVSRVLGNLIVLVVAACLWCCNASCSTVAAAGPSRGWL